MATSESKHERRLASYYPSTYALNRKQSVFFMIRKASNITYAVCIKQCTNFQLQLCYFLKAVKINLDYPTPGTLNSSSAICWKIYVLKMFQMCVLNRSFAKQTINTLSSLNTCNFNSMSQWSYKSTKAPYVTTLNRKKRFEFPHIYTYCVLTAEMAVNLIRWWWRRSYLWVHWDTFYPLHI